MAEKVSLRVNGIAREVTSAPAGNLLAALRDQVGLTGTKYGCGEGRCGACTVFASGDRKAITACTATIAAVASGGVTTIEGLAGRDGRLHPLQQAFLDEGAMQCGYCTPGMIMAAYALLASNPDPTDDDIRRGMERNICRCGMYAPIVAAVRRAAASMRSRTPGRAR